MFETLYSCILAFVAFYPIVTSIMWVSFAITYKIRWEEMHHEIFPKHFPTVSILIPLYNEGYFIEDTLKAVCALTYPSAWEVMIINDGSTDDTLEKIKPFLKHPHIRLLNKEINQGKALALNDAIGLLNGEIIVILDADAQPEADLLYHLTWHFQHARVGAVTGHPRVYNVTNLLTRIQVMEFTSIIGLLRRSQRVWGRIVTVSGIVAAFRKEALYDALGFDPTMYTEDIDITWRIEKKAWDVRYEPRAIVWMRVPDTLKSFFRQRLRWARGLLQILKEHSNVTKSWRLRRMWAIYYEACLSTLWNTLYGFVLVFETINFIVLDVEKGFFENVSFQWLVIMASFSLFQLIVGGLMESKHDKDVFYFFPYTIFYPAFYWVFMTIITWCALPILWKKRFRVKWYTKREKNVEV